MEASNVKEAKHGVMGVPQLVTRDKRRGWRFMKAGRQTASMEILSEGNRVLVTNMKFKSHKLLMSKVRFAYSKV